MLLQGPLCREWAGSRGREAGWSGLAWPSEGGNKVCRFGSWMRGDDIGVIACVVIVSENAFLFIFGC